MYYTAQELVETLNREEGEALTVRKVRYYAQIGVLSSPELVNGKKKYSTKHLEELRAVRRLQKTGSKLEDIKTEIKGLDASSLYKVSENAIYFSEKPILDKNVCEINPDVSVMLSHRTYEHDDFRDGLIQVIEGYYQKHKGEL